MPPESKSIVGRPAIRDWATPFFDLYDLREESDERDIVVHGDRGFIRAHWTWILTLKAGGDSIADGGNSISILAPTRRSQIALR
jgi:hypothetical protein